MKKVINKKIVIIFIICLVLTFLVGFYPKGRNIELTILDKNEQVLHKTYTINFNTYVKVLLKHSGNYKKYYESLNEKEKGNFLLLINEDLNKDVDNIIKINEKAYKNAQVLNFTNGKFDYKNEEYGTKIDKNKIIEKIVNLDKNCKVINLEKEKILPEIDKSQLLQKSKKMVEFSTNYENSSYNRKQNIKVASSKIDNKIVYPNTTFSFNEVVGKRNKENGFYNSKIIYNGELVEGIGGGVCQVSSTLYVAWVQAGLAVKQSRSHSQKVSYIKQGLDTTVTEWCDLVLYNDTAFPIYIDTIYTDKELEVVLYGAPVNCRIELVVEKHKEIIEKEYDKIILEKESDSNEKEEKATTENEKTSQENNKSIGNIDWEEGETFRIIKEPVNGVILYSYRNYYLGNELVYKEKLRSNYYAPKKGKIVYRAKEDIEKEKIEMEKREKEENLDDSEIKEESN